VRKRHAVRRKLLSIRVIREIRGSDCFFSSGFPASLVSVTQGHQISFQEFAMYSGSVPPLRLSS
jgi:hypothetical protein